MNHSKAIIINNLDCIYPKYERENLHCGLIMWELEEIFNFEEMLIKLRCRLMSKIEQCESENRVDDFINEVNNEIGLMKEKLHKKRENCHNELNELTSDTESDNSINNEYTDESSSEATEEEADQ